MDGFLDLENINSEEIVKIYKTQPSVTVPPSISGTGSWPRFSGSPKHGNSAITPTVDSSPSKTLKLS